MYELSLEASPGERTSVPRVELREARWRLREEDPGRDMLREDITSHAQDDLDLDLSAALNSSGGRSEMSTFINFDFVAFLRINSVARRFEALDTTDIQNYTKKDTIIEKCLKEQKNVKFSLQDRIFSIILVHKMLDTRNLNWTPRHH